MNPRRVIDDVASFVPSTVIGRLAADPDWVVEPVLEQWHSAVLFADISGFTRLAEELSRRGPSGIEDLTRVLNTDIGCLVDVISRYGGEIDKFAGDALMAV